MNSPEITFCEEDQKAVFTFLPDSPFSEVGALVQISYHKIGQDTWEVPSVLVMIDNCGLSIDYQVNLTEQITLIVDAQRWLISNRELVEKTLAAM